MSEPRRYGRWAGNPKGVPEDTAQCIEEVYPGMDRGWIPYQCRRRRGHGPDGLYCKQHGIKAERLLRRGSSGNEQR